MKFKELNENDMPRERLIKKGVNSLSDSELLAIILRTGTHNVDVIDLANNILKKYSFNQLKELSFNELIKIPGIKKAKACSLLAIFEIAKRSINVNNNQFSFNNSENIYNYIYKDILLEGKEVLIILYLDTKLRLLKEEKFENFNPNSIIFPLRKIIHTALNFNSTGIVIIHNHPSGDTTPSIADKLVTNKVKKSLNSIDIDLVDHLVVSVNNYYSFLDNGILDAEYEYDFLGD